MYHIVIAGLAHGGPYLSRQHKPVAVYVAPKTRFLTVKVFDDLKHVLAEGDSNGVERVVSELHLDI